MDPMRLVAHRGYAARFTENSLDAMRAAIEVGARFIETDIQLTADAVPVLFHDRDMARLCSVAGAVHEYTHAALPPFAAARGGHADGAPLATLQQLAGLLQKFPAVQVFIELKRVSIETFGADTVLNQVLPILRPLRDRAILISFDYDILQRARSRSWPRVGAVLNKWGERTLPAVSRLRPDYIFADVEDLPRFRRLDTGNAVLVVYEVDDLRLAAQLIRRGAAMIETFDIGKFLGHDRPQRV
jgi:glycerophosphoryl diester phosphodiesterase